MLSATNQSKIKVLMIVMTIALVMSMAMMRAEAAQTREQATKIDIISTEVNAHLKKYPEIKVSNVVLKRCPKTSTTEVKIKLSDGTEITIKKHGRVFITSIGGEGTKKCAEFVQILDKIEEKVKSIMLNSETQQEVQPKWTWPEPLPPDEDRVVHFYEVDEEPMLNSEVTLRQRGTLTRANAPLSGWVEVGAEAYTAWRGLEPYYEAKRGVIFAL